ncbi:hypothetical protein FO519_003925 [Halicephalobus sp. NKZ332]|nr:hypothetical protein FO519_003925 [Halicephalobus sp. NKZ332]
MEVDEEPPENLPRSKHSSKKPTNTSFENEISPNRAKGSGSKNNESQRQANSRITKNQRIGRSEKQEIIDRLTNHMGLMERKTSSINSESINDLLTKIKADPDFKVDDDSSSERSSNSENETESPKNKSRKKNSAMAKELRSLNPGSEPPSKRRKTDPSTPKRKRTLSSGESKKKGQRSPVKTRGIVTSTEMDSLSFCLICENTEGPFLRCNVCEFRFHPSCLQISLPIKYPSVSWRCFDCLRCSECMGYIDDAENVQCTRCGRAYHGYCRPLGSVGGYPFDHWHCAKCIKKIRGSKEMERFKKNRIAKKRIKQGYVDKKPRIFFIPKSGMKNDKEKKNWIKFKKVLALTKPLDLEVPGKTEILEKKMSQNLNLKMKRRRFGLKLLNKKINEVHLRKALKKSDFVTETVEDISEKLTEEYSNCDVEINGEIEPALLPYQTVWPTEEYMEDMKDIKDMKNLKKQKSPKSPKSSSRSPSDMEVYGKMVDSLDYNDEVYQFLHFGPTHIVPAKRSIPSADPEFWNAKLVFACHKCFWLFLSPLRFRLHLNMCECSHPPGNEIYRDKIKTPDARERTISFFEVVGEEEMDYCRRLCTVASALLPAKSVTNEVEMFKFYVLTEFDEKWGFIPAGFFSKENKPSQNNNLSCLLVFNQFRQSGYGKLLVDLSYHLSKKEGKFGSPEHPLSDDGLYLYRSYWTSVIFQYLRKHRNEKKISFEDMSKETHIYIDDIVSTLLANGMIKQPSGGKTFLDCVKAWFMDIRIIRRRAVDEEKLVWEPEIDPNEEHNDRYVCSSDDDDY